MQKLIYFHRHGQTAHSARNSGYGNNQHQSMLTSRGIQEADLLGQELVKHGPFDLYLTSPMPRAVQTATIVQRNLGEVELSGEPALTEPVNEQPKEVWKRVTKLVQDLEKSQNHRILLSTHGYIFYCLVTYYRGLELNELKNFTNPPTGAYAWVELLDGNVIRSAWECKAHLAVLDKPAMAII